MKQTQLTIDTSIKEVLDQFYDYQQNTAQRSLSTLANYKMAFSVLQKLSPEIASMRDFNRYNLDHFLSKLNTRKRTIGKGREIQGIKNSTKMTYVRRLKALSKWAEIRIEEYTAPDWSDFKYSVRYTDIRALSEEQIGKIIASTTVLNQDLYLMARDDLIFTMLTYLGIRRGELLGLEVRDIDFHNKTIHIRSEISKSVDARFLPIPSILNLKLENYLQYVKKNEYSSPYLILSNRGKKFTKYGLKHLVKRYENHVGFSFHVHQFRHSFACRLARHNFSVPQIQKALGHKSLEMTQSYLRSLGVDDIRGGLDNLDVSIIPIV